MNQCGSSLLIPSVTGTFHCCHLGFACQVALDISGRFSRWRLMDNAAWPVTRRKCTFITTLYPTSSHTQLKVINSYTMVEIIVNLWYFFIWNVENITLNLHTIYHIEFFCMFLESCVYTAKNRLTYSGTFSIIHNFIWPVLMHNIKCTIVKFMQIKKAMLSLPLPVHADQCHDFLSQNFNWLRVLNFNEKYGYY